MTHEKDKTNEYEGLSLGEIVARMAVDAARLKQGAVNETNPLPSEHLAKEAARKNSGKAH